MTLPFRTASAGARASLAAAFLGLALVAVPAAALDPIRPPQPLTAPPPGAIETATGMSYIVLKPAPSPARCCASARTATTRAPVSRALARVVPSLLHRSMRNSMNSPATVRAGDGAAFSTT